MGLKYEFVVLILGGARHHLIFDEHQFLVRMLSARISLIYAYAQHVLKEGPFQILNFYPYTEHMRNKLMRMCAADFSLLNLPKGKSLGRSKPATNS